VQHNLQRLKINDIFRIKNNKTTHFSP